MESSDRAVTFLTLCSFHILALLLSTAFPCIGGLAPFLFDFISLLVCLSFVYGPVIRCYSDFVYLSTILATTDHFTLHDEKATLC